MHTACIYGCLISRQKPFRRCTSGDILFWELKAGGGGQWCFLVNWTKSCKSASTHIRVLALPCTENQLTCISPLKYRMIKPEVTKSQSHNRSLTYSQLARLSNHFEFVWQNSSSAVSSTDRMVNIQPMWNLRDMSSSFVLRKPFISCHDIYEVYNTFLSRRWWVMTPLLSA